MKLSQGGTEYAGHTPYNKAVHTDDNEKNAAESSKLLDDTIPLQSSPQGSPVVSWEGDRGNSHQAPECLPRRVIFEEVGDTVESSPTQDFPTVTLADVMKGHDDKAPRNSTGCGSASDSDLSAELVRRWLL